MRKMMHMDGSLKHVYYIIQLSKIACKRLSLGYMIAIFNIEMNVWYL